MSDAMIRLTNAAIHAWDMFIKPTGLAGVLERHELQPGEMAGLGPSAWPGGCAPRPAQSHPGSACAVPCA
jgi:hypothetical protein